VAVEARQGLRAEAGSITLWSALGLGIGWWLGAPGFGLAAGLLAYLIRHVLSLMRVLRWLQARPKTPPPVMRGIHADLVAAVQRLERRSEKRKRKMGRILARFREATSALPDAAVILGRQGQIDWSNPAASELLGLEWARDTGRPVAELISNPVFVEYLRSGSYAQPLELPSPVNNALMLSIHITRYGKKHQRLLIARDITLVYKLSRVRRDFVADVSHELRTPLTVLSGFLETLQDSADECPQWRRSLELMRQQSARMQNIVTDLLMLSRLEMGGALPLRDWVDVGEELQGIVETARSLCSDKRQLIDLQTTTRRRVRGNANELRGVFSNLVFNAVYHTPPGTRITVTWKVEDDIGELTVQDTGQGIAPQHIPRLTERFYRVDKARSRRTGGTGLGLAIVKHSLARCNAELLIASEEGKGSSFTCRFPAAVMEPADAAERRIAASRVPPPQGADGGP
jgi:two-component system phosphate regulon sensor histidine kinase PhoR